MMQNSNIEAFGNLFKNDPDNIRMTLNAVRFLLEQHTKDVNMKHDLRFKIKQLESQLNLNEKTIERSKLRIAQLNKENEENKILIKQREVEHK